MTVETTDRKVTHEMSELLTEYAFTFRALVSTPSDIKAIIRNTVTNVSEDMVYVEDLPEDPDPVTDRLKYTVVVNEDGVGGTIEVAVAADDDNEVTIYRQTTDLQSSAYEDYNQFPAKTVESDFDRRTMVTQEAQEALERTIRLPITSDANPELPSPEADAFIGWNDDGTAIINRQLPDPSTLEKASQVEAEAGTNNDKFMTPLRTKQAIDELVVPVTVVDSLVSTSSTSALSAKQGKVLKDSIDALDLGAMVQVANVQTGVSATGSTVIPRDNTIPQNNEGNEYMTLAITPKSATNKLKIEVVWIGIFGGNENGVVALFQDTTANALACATGGDGTAVPHSVNFTHFMTAGTTSSTTFKVRAGGSAGAGTTHFNIGGNSVTYGGVLASSITITEIKA